VLHSQATRNRAGSMRAGVAVGPVVGQTGFRPA
jgi:hypothetical protein